MTANQFWEWFSENNSKYFFLNQIEDEHLKEKILEEFMSQLHKYCNQLFFLIGGLPDKKQELIITAEGNREYFNEVLELVNVAPKIKNWEIIAFKPPQNPDFITHYSNIELEPTKMWFMPLESEEDIKSIGLRVCSNNFDPKFEQDFTYATYIVLDTLLGEKSCAEDIEYLEVGLTPVNPEDEGLIELVELPDYIKWKKNNS